MASNDISVSALRGSSMADAVSVGTLAAVEELVTSPPAGRISPTSAAAEEDAVVGLFALESVSFPFGNTVTSAEAIWFV